MEASEVIVEVREEERPDIVSPAEDSAEQQLPLPNEPPKEASQPPPADDSQPDQESSPSSSPQQGSNAHTPTSREDRDRFAILALQTKIDELREEMKRKEESHENEVGDLRRKMAHEVSSSVERGMKRNENVAMQQLRQKERQIVTQSTEIAKLKKELTALRERLDGASKELQNERRNVKLGVDERSEKDAESETIHRQHSLELRTIRSVAEELELKMSAARAREENNQQQIGALESELQNYRQEVSSLKLTAANGLGEENDKLRQRGLPERRPSSLDPLPTPPASPDAASGGPPSGSASPLSTPGSSANNREAARVDSMLRSKDKQVVAQSTEIARLRKELGNSNTTLRRIENELAEAQQKLSAEQKALERLKEERADAMTVVGQHSQELSEFRGKYTTLQREHSDLTSTSAAQSERVSALESQVAEYRKFKATHTTCTQYLEEKDAKIIALTRDLETATQDATNKGSSIVALERKLADVKHDLSKKDDIYSAMAEQKAAQAKALSAESSTKDHTITELRRLVEKNREEREKQQQLALADQNELEREIEKIKERLTEARGAANVAEQTAKQRDVDSAGKFAAQQKEIERLKQEFAAVDQERRKAEAKASASAADTGEKRSAIHRMSLELEETKQRCARFEKQLVQRTEEVTTLIAHINDIDGDTQGTVTTTRRLLGMLESISVEMCHRFVGTLRQEYMRGAPKTILFLINVFHMDEETAMEVAQILSRVFFCMKNLSLSLKKLSEEVGLPEASLRKICSAFTGAIEEWKPSERRQILLDKTPAGARSTYAGVQRLAFLHCVSSTNAKDTLSVLREKSPSQMHIVALVCSYLNPVIRGGTAFATHSLITHHNKREGHTMLIAMDPSSKTFNLMECQVTMNTALVAIVSGTYRRSQSHSNPRNIRLHFECREKRDGICQSSNSATDSWVWSETEVIPAAEATVLQYYLENDARHDGLQLVEATSHDGPQFPLKELSVEEVSSVQELYGGELPLNSMLSHRSWRDLCF